MKTSLQATSGSRSFEPQEVALKARIGTWLRVSPLGFSLTVFSVLLAIGLLAPTLLIILLLALPLAFFRRHRIAPSAPAAAAAPAQMRVLSADDVQEMTRQQFRAQGAAGPVRDKFRGIGALGMRRSPRPRDRAARDRAARDRAPQGTPPLFACVTAVLLILIGAPLQAVHGAPVGAGATVAFCLLFLLGLVATRSAMAEKHQMAEPGTESPVSEGPRLEALLDQALGDEPEPLPSDLPDKTGPDGRYGDVPIPRTVGSGNPNSD